VYPVSILVRGGDGGNILNRSCGCKSGWRYTTRLTCVSGNEKDAEAGNDADENAGD
jgi:hypothetical protein